MTELMLHAKDGSVVPSYRWYANNSAVVDLRNTSQEDIIALMLKMVNSKNGEPGLFDREAAKRQNIERRTPKEFGTNPCGEVILRDMQFCNLSTAVARPYDSERTLSEKVGLATIIGTIQSMATSFPSLRDEWTTNCEEERLLGVNLIGSYGLASRSVAGHTEAIA